MNLILRPVGRGAWAVITLHVDGRHAPLPLEFAVNQRVVLAGQTYRIAKVLPAASSLRLAQLERAASLALAALVRSSPHTTATHEWKPEGWRAQRTEAIDALASLLEARP